MLSNNAGLAARVGHFNDANCSDWNDMINTNICRLLAVSQEVSKQWLNGKWASSISAPLPEYKYAKKEMFTKPPNMR